MNPDITPRDSRYVPVPQQPYCCGPACLTMIMLRHGIPPLPQELIGYHLGLVVPSERKEEFWNPRHAERPVVASGFGTQIQNEAEFGMQKALDKLGIPLRFAYAGADGIETVDDLKTRLQSTIAANEDVLVCLNWGALTDKPEKNWGHILCVDTIDGDTIRLIDTDVGAKWKTFPARKVFDALKTHGNANYGGLWTFRRKAA
jgi:hypothetical protein